MNCEEQGMDMDVDHEEEANFCISLNDDIDEDFFLITSYPWYVAAHPVMQAWPGPCLCGQSMLRQVARLISSPAVCSTPAYHISQSQPH